MLMPYERELIIRAKDLLREFLLHMNCECEPHVGEGYCRVCDAKRLIERVERRLKEEDEQSFEPEEPSCPKCGGHVAFDGQYCPECNPYEEGS